MNCDFSSKSLSPRRPTFRESVPTAPILVALLLTATSLVAANDPEIGRLVDRALEDAENFRKQMQGAQYEAKVRVQEWNGRGQLRGTAKATMIVKPGDPHPITYVSRQVEGKVKLPDDDDRTDDNKDKTTLPEFARNHKVAERFDVSNTGTDEVAGERATRIQFTPNHTQPNKNTGDKFLDVISGTLWINEARSRLVKLDMRLTQPFQLFWILAVLKDLSIQYELITPGDILGHAKVNVAFTIATPVYTIRQQHDVDLDHFRRRDAVVAGNIAQR
jgi:hypothetical protein